MRNRIRTIHGTSLDRVECGGLVEDPRLPLARNGVREDSKPERRTSEIAGCSWGHFGLVVWGRW